METMVKVITKWTEYKTNTKLLNSLKITSVTEKNKCIYSYIQLDKPFDQNTT